MYMKIYLLAAIITICLIVSSCKSRSKDPSPSSSVPILKGTLALHLHTYLDNNEIDGYTSTGSEFIYTDENDRKAGLTIAQLYLSEISLIRLDGSMYAIQDTVILKTLDNDVYMLGQVPIGNYRSIRFRLGFNASKNPQILSGLGIYSRSEMWYNSSQQSDGYIFLNVQGKIDTSAAHNSSISNIQPFKYQIGAKAADSIFITMPNKNFTVLNTQRLTFLHIIVDYNKIFNGIDLTNQNNLQVINPEDNNTTLAKNIVKNIPSMFVYEQ